MTPGMFSCASVRLRGWYIYVVSDFVALHLTDVWSRLELHQEILILLILTNPYYFGA